MHNVLDAQALQIVVFEKDPNDFLKCMFIKKTETNLKFIPGLQVTFVSKTEGRISPPRAVQNR